MPTEMFDENNEPYTYGDGLPPHVAGSDTSTEAAVSELPYLSQKEAIVLQVFQQAEPTGAICGEVEEVTRLTHQSASARVRGLVLKGQIHDTGARRVWSRTGKKQRVYRLGRQQLTVRRDRWTTPFTQRQIAALAERQASAKRHEVHGYTCAESGHNLLLPARDGWVCPWDGCSYVQHWAHPLF